jgi:hypothetical protein
MTSSAPWSEIRVRKKIGAEPPLLDALTPETVSTIFQPEASKG